MDSYLYGRVQDCPVCNEYDCVRLFPAEENEHLYDETIIGSWLYCWHCSLCSTRYTAVQLIELLEYDEVDDGCKAD